MKIWLTNSNTALLTLEKQVYDMFGKKKKLLMHSQRNADGSKEIREKKKL